MPARLRRRSRHFASSMLLFSGGITNSGTIRGAAGGICSVRPFRPSSAPSSIPGSIVGIAQTAIVVINADRRHRHRSEPAAPCGTVLLSAHADAINITGGAIVGQHCRRRSERHAELRDRQRERSLTDTNDFIGVNDGRHQFRHRGAQRRATAPRHGRFVIPAARSPATARSIRRGWRRHHQFPAACWSPAPGAPLGTFTIVGALNFNCGSGYVIDPNPSAGMQFQDRRVRRHR